MGFDQLDFMVGAYLFSLPIHVPPILPFLPCPPIVMVGTILATTVG
jgi:hypothetical protein